MDVLTLEDIVLFLHIGIHQHEKVRKQKVVITIKLSWLPQLTKKAVLNPSLEATLDYESFYARLKTLAEQEHLLLLESLAEKLSQLCLSYQQVEKTEISVSKENVLPYLGRSTFTLFRSQAWRARR